MGYGSCYIGRAYPSSSRALYERSTNRLDCCERICEGRLGWRPSFFSWCPLLAHLADKGFALHMFDFDPKWTSGNFVFPASRLGRREIAARAVDM
jgi:hypothetical protein